MRGENKGETFYLWINNYGEFLRGSVIAKDFM